MIARPDWLFGGPAVAPAAPFPWVYAFVALLGSLLPKGRKEED